MSNLEPITRKEQYLNRLTGEEQAIPETPVTRTEQYLAKLCGEETEIPSSPITREETYLAYLNGENVTLPEPITRLEQFMAFAAEKSETKPTPLTREEFYWDKYQGGAVLKDFPGLPASIVTVTDAVAKPLDSLKIAITPVQAGSGDPSPDNIRPISGWTEAKVMVVSENLFDENYPNINSDTQKIILNVGNGSFTLSTTTPLYNRAGTTEANLFLQTGEGNVTASTQNDGVWDGRDKTVNSTDGKVTIKYRIFNDYEPCNPQNFKTYLVANKKDYTITFPSEAGTVYGGTLDVTNGVLTVTAILQDLGVPNYTKREYGANKVFYYYIANCPIIASGKKANAICDIFKTTTNEKIYAGTNEAFSITRSINDEYGVVRINSSTYSSLTESEFKTAMSGHYIIRELATPITYQLTPTEITMLLGTNNLWADTGDILEGKYWGKNSSATQAMLNTLRDAGEITPTEEPEENDER